MLNRGCMTDSFTTINKDTKYDLYEPIGWEDLAADNSNADKCTTWSTWTETGTHIPVSPVNATKYIQFRIKYVNNAVNSRRRVNAAATTGTEETLYIPDYFETSRPSDGASDTEAAAYTWALQGTHTVIKNEGIETGIEEILDEEEAAEAVEGVEVETIYYNLQGQRVKNPDRGIYIRVHGNKATKVAL
jgi:hypothetical protein